ncbi:hypothetical protein BV22DRAFT_1199073 [Leucogyrophana mollusca]|uniref:Uncharacterized protein n=1 Tax=Leucogyrophana mollusca TaxID=85980 RepID=A0ACB8B3D1_9AGAM|nr:hypothetical protein BV22DRAFT_1199073 [Leucogyrophana mollusca]
MTRVILTVLGATDLTTQIQHPHRAKFYALVEAENRRERTRTRAASSSEGKVHWNDRFTLTLRNTSDLCISIYTTFQNSPSANSAGAPMVIFGMDELVGKATIAVGDLLEYGKKGSEFTLPTRRPRGVSLRANLILRAQHLGGDRVLTSNHLHKDIKIDILEPNPSGGPHRGSVTLRPAMHLDRSVSLNTLANDCYASFHRSGDTRSLQLALQHYSAALDLCPLDHPERSTSLNNLAAAQLARFRHQGNTSDLELAFENARVSLESCPPHHPDHSACLNNFAIILHARFQQLGHISDLKQALEHNASALKYRPPGHPDRWMTLNSIGSVYLTYFQQRKVPRDLEMALRHYRAALDAVPSGMVALWILRSNLANALCARFQRQGEPGDLERAIVHYRAALHTRPFTDPGRSKSFNNLGAALYIRSEHFGNKTDLDMAIQNHRSALRLCPPGHPDRPISLYNLAGALSARFRRRGQTADLKMALKLHRAALWLRPAGHPHRSLSLKGFVHTLRLCFQQRDQLPDLKLIIAPDDITLQLEDTPAPASVKSTTTGLIVSYQKPDSPTDLELAHEYFRTAQNSRKPDDPDRFALLDGLANILRARSEHQASESKHQSIDEPRPTVPDNFDSLISSEVINDLVALYEKHDTITHIIQAIEHFRGPPLQLSDHHRSPSLLGNLANAFRIRFDHNRDARDLDTSIEYHRAALDLHPEGSTLRVESLNSLAIALMARYRLLRDPGDLRRAVNYHFDALELCLQGHRDYSITLLNLAIAIQKPFPARLSHGVELTDLRLEIEENLEAMTDGNAPGHPLLAGVHGHLATEYLERYDDSKQNMDLHEGFRHRELASTYVSGGPWQQFRASYRWIRDAEMFGHSSAMRAYRTSLSLLDRHITVAFSVVSGHRAVKQVPAALVADAASCAVRQKLVSAAVELLEQGRTVLWTQLARFRTPLEDLRNVPEVGRRLAHEFERLSEELLALQHSTGRPEAEARRYGQLSMEWDSLIAQIRKAEGFSHFLMPPSFSHLQEAARDGPVIVVNSSQYSCDAIIVLHIGPPIHVPLVQITLDDVAQLSSKFADILKCPAAPGEDKRRESQLIALLRELWDLVVRPIVEELSSIEQVPKGSRIWWCPTSKFTSLPLHAAGCYRKGEPNLSNVFVSSYTPTLSALIRSRRSRAAMPTRFAAIGQANPGGDLERELKSVDKEIRLVQMAVPEWVPFTCLSGRLATDIAALDALRAHSWVHLACHGRQDTVQPFASSFAMSNRPLSLLDIINADVGCPEFAFLSACHTAVGDYTIPDEVIHLAAGMQFAGFKSVIGTMWAVDDQVAHHMVTNFYDSLFSEGMDWTKAAGALNKAARNVDKKQVPLEQRIVFIHIGA